MRLGSWLREVRLEKNLSLRESAKLLGFGPIYLGEIERGVRIPTSAEMYKIEQTFGSKHESEKNMEANSRLRAQRFEEFIDRIFGVKT